jgi:oligosaccharyltransferase complex subunit alpha (ribophorin I)
MRVETGFYRHIDVFPPFAPITQERSTHITYLDSIGRPAVTLSFENLTDKHDGLVYVSDMHGWLFGRR